LVWGKQRGWIKLEVGDKTRKSKKRTVMINFGRGLLYRIGSIKGIKNR